MTKTSGDHADKNALVFGASSFAGKEIGIALANWGVNVCLLDLESHVEGGLLDHFRGLEGVTVLQKNIESGEENAVNKAIDESVQELGSLDYLICAYYFEELNELAGLDESSLDPWDELLQDWVMNTFLVTRAAFSHLERSGSGRVIFLNTTTGYTGEGEGEGEVTAEGSVYECAGSSAVTGVMTSIARDIIPKGVTVNGIALGPKYADDIDRLIWATNFWLSGKCEYACGQMIRLY